MRLRPRSLVGPILVLLAVTAVGYAAVRFKRDTLVDLAAPRTAATRFLASENLYRPEDGHYQFKYLPAFAPLMVPLSLMPTRVAEVTWFALMVTWRGSSSACRSPPCPTGGGQRRCFCG